MRTKLASSITLPLLVGLALLHGLLYALLVPPWQTPDEPAQFQYAAMVARLGRTPTPSDADANLERAIAASLARNHFFEYLIGHAPPQTPQTFEEAQNLFFMPSQIGNDPPLYFWLAALPIRLLSARPIEGQLLAIRLIGVALFAGTVLCAHGAARELALGSGFALAAGLLVALQPMAAFIAASAGNDGLANLIGAALCWVLLRIVRQGLSVRRAGLVLALVLLGILVKRTLLPQAGVVCVVGVGYLLARLACAPIGWLTRLALGVAMLAVLLCARVAMARDRAPTRAADWVDVDSGSGAQRISVAPGTGRAALELAPGQQVAQVLPDVAAEWAQNQELYVDMRLWTDGAKVRGALVIDFGWQSVEQPFEIGPRGKVVRMHTFIPLYAPYLYVGLRAQNGELYADRVHAESARRRGFNLLANPDLANPAIQPGSASALLSRMLRLREFGWVWRSGALFGAPPLGGWLLGRIFFASFWGQFGWMSLPLVGGTLWEGALWLLCVGGLIGTLSFLLASWRESWRRRALLVLALMIAAGVLLPFLNAYTAPRNQVIQQGRYLFPALAPVALLIVLGWRALLPPRWRRAGLLAGALFGVCFAAAALAMLAGYYGSF